VSDTDWELGPVFSVTTGMLMCDFGEVHKLFEYLCGGPVWTHEIPSIADSCRDEVLRQRPDLATVEAPDLTGVEDVTGYLRGWLQEQAETFTPLITLRGGLAAQRNKRPLETLSDLVGEDRVVPVIVDKP
jgi:hypothetical protein